VRMRRHLSPLLTWGLVVLVVLGVGCGQGGVSAGATVSVYVAAPLCEEARRELKTAGEGAQGVMVHAICLAPVQRDRRVRLAVAGSNARRATEDSTSVAFLESPGPAAGFSRRIVESADIAWVETSSAAPVVRRVLHAVADADDSSLRDAVRESLG